MTEIAQVTTGRKSQKPEADIPTSKAKLGEKPNLKPGMTRSVRSKKPKQETSGRANSVRGLKLKRDKWAVEANWFWRA